VRGHAGGELGSHHVNTVCGIGEWYVGGAQFRSRKVGHNGRRPRKGRRLPVDADVAVTYLTHNGGFAEELRLDRRAFLG